MANASRRALLAGLTASPVAMVPIGAMSAPADLDRLWTAYLAAHARGVELSRDVERLVARLPWWAAPGPRWLVREGCSPPQDNWSGAPAIEDLGPPEIGSFRLWRPTEHDIQNDYDRHVRTFGDVSGRSAAFRDRRLAELAERLARRDRERDAVGLPAANELVETNSDHTTNLQIAIEALPFSLNVLAAQILANTVAMGNRTTTMEDGSTYAASQALRSLRPMLTGVVAVTVADFLDNSDRALCYSPLWGSWWPEELGPDGDYTALPSLA